MPPSTDGRIDLCIPRGAFGSGEHETTASCLEVLETLPDIAGSRVLDLGSGTAILTIAALRLGARSAVCVDIDPVAVRAAKITCELNGLTDHIEHVCGTLDEVKAEDFDVVLANIYGDILLDCAADLVGKARPGATLVLSGVRWVDNFDVRKRYAQLGCDIQVNRLMDEFSTIVLGKR